MLRGKFSKLPPEIHLLIHCFCFLKNKLPPPAPPPSCAVACRALRTLGTPPGSRVIMECVKMSLFAAARGAEYPKNPSLQTVGAYRTPHRWSAFPQLSVLDRARSKTNS